MSAYELVSSFDNTANTISKRLLQDLAERFPKPAVEAAPAVIVEEVFTEADISEDFIPAHVRRHLRKLERRKNRLPGQEGKPAKPHAAVKDRILVTLVVWQKDVDTDELIFKHSSNKISAFAAELEAREKAKENGFGVYRVEKIDRVVYLI